MARSSERSRSGRIVILLDLHNLLADQRNGRQPVEEVLSELPLDRVLEIHVAGGFELDGYYLDAHVGGPDVELLALLNGVIARLPNIRLWSRSRSRVDDHAGRHRSRSDSRSVAPDL